MTKGFVAGIDVGGTFTDAVIYDEERSKLYRTKVLTTADDQSIGTVGALQRLFTDLDIDAGRLRRFNHGYTVGINAALTRTGAKSGLLCTKGHRENMDSGGMGRPFDEGVLYNPYWQRPHQVNPIIPRRYRREIAERLGEAGNTLLELQDDEIRREVRFLKGEGVESIGVCFVNAYVDRRHEERAIRIIEEEFPGAYVQSSKIYPVAGELKRTFVVALDVYCGPKINTYLERLKSRMAEEIGYTDEIYIMQMGGGLATREMIVEAPVCTLQSGPVAGMLGSEFYARKILDTDNLICIDVGGTSTDIGLVREGSAEVTRDWELDYSIPYAMPTIDVRSIGAGGGSLIVVDEMGSLRVGPESAGSKPGPACYGLGGTEPAVTDACVAMGIIQPELFLEGRMNVDRGKALEALGRVAARIDMDPLLLAQGAYELVTLNIAEACEKALISRGLHPQGYSLMGFGAAGPMFAVSVARELSIPEVVIPYFPGGFAALGMLTSRLKVQHAVSPMSELAALGPERLNAVVDQIEQACIEDLVRQGIKRADVVLERTLCGMYRGQSWDQQVPVAVERYDDANFGAIRGYFDRHYDQVFGYQAQELPIFLTTVRAMAYGPYPDVVLPNIEKGGDTPDAAAVIMRRDLHMDRETHRNVPFYDRFALKAGNLIPGPAIIDDRLSTIVVNKATHARIDDYGNVIVDIPANANRARP